MSAVIGWAFVLFWAPLPAIAHDASCSAKRNGGRSGAAALIQSSARMAKNTAYAKAALREMAAHEPYVPGSPGGAWTSDEMLVVRAKLLRLIAEGKAVGDELGVEWNVGSVFHDISELPDGAKLLRLGFHDCLRYTDGSGGCDGCLEMIGMNHRYDQKDWRTRKFEYYEGRKDGHNNGLGKTVQLLEEIYQNPAFPARTPHLKVSLQQSGKSRADLWAFAALVAVEQGIRLNNFGCTQPSAVGNTDCHPRSNESDCIVTPRPFVFQWGRRDCDASYSALKDERHPDPLWNGSDTVEFFKSDFNFTGREVVAIMGAHTLGSMHADISLLAYTWKARSRHYFNNGYYRNMVAKPEWFYPFDTPHMSSRCSEAYLGNSSRGKPIANWRPLMDKQLKEHRGPNQWFQAKLVCPKCHDLEARGKVLDQNTNGCSDIEGHWERVWCEKFFDKWSMCCTNLEPGEFCKPGCDEWASISGNDEVMLNSDFGLYKAFEVMPDGSPRGCAGITEENTMEAFMDKPPAGCEPNRMEEPSGSTPLYQVVEEYADNQQKFISDFQDTLEKMLRNGYSSESSLKNRAESSSVNSAESSSVNSSENSSENVSENSLENSSEISSALVSAPLDGMSGFHCPRSHLESSTNSYYSCFRSVYKGCYENWGGVHSHTGTKHIGACQRQAQEGGSPLFAVQYPQGSWVEGEAECLALDSLPSTAQKPDADCEVEVLDGFRLGGSWRMAIYGPP